MDLVDMGFGGSAHPLTMFTDNGQLGYNFVGGKLVVRPGGNAEFALHTEPLHGDAFVSSGETRAFRAIVHKIQIRPPAAGAISPKGRFPGQNTWTPTIR